VLRATLPDTKTHGTELNGTEGTGVRIALGQLESGTDIEANLAAIDRFAAEAAARRRHAGRLPGVRHVREEDRGRDVPGGGRAAGRPHLPGARRHRPRHGITLVAGVVETSDEEGRAYNTLVAFGPSGGRLACTGRSTCSTRRASGSRRSSSRARPPSPWCSSPGERVFGLMTCYDLRFPELARSWPTPARRCCWSARPGCRARTRRSSGWR
jgi:predicted amidohydrolase